MLCDVCGVREATIHKTVTHSNVPAVSGKTMPVRHYCTRCFEKASPRIKPTPGLEQERDTPHHPV